MRTQRPDMVEVIPSHIRRSIVERFPVQHRANVPHGLPGTPERYESVLRELEYRASRIPPAHHSVWRDFEELRTSLEGLAPREYNGSRTSTLADRGAA